MFYYWSNHRHTYNGTLNWVEENLKLPTSVNWKCFSSRSVGTTYSRETGERVCHCPCSGGSHTGFQDQPPRSSRTFHFTPVSCKSAEFQTQCLLLRSVLRHSGEDSSLSSTGMYTASFVGAQSVGGPWVAEQGPSVVPTQHVPLALVATSWLGVEAGNGPTPRLLNPQFPSRSMSRSTTCGR